MRADAKRDAYRQQSFHTLNLTQLASADAKFADWDPSFTNSVSRHGGSGLACACVLATPLFFQIMYSIDPRTKMPQDDTTTDNAAETEAPQTEGQPETAAIQDSDLDAAKAAWDAEGKPAASDEGEPVTSDAVALEGSTPDGSTDNVSTDNASVGQTSAEDAGDGDDEGEGGAEISQEDLERAAELAEPFVGQWNTLISTTNWEKGRIISEWRAELIASGVDATQYSDEAWSKRVGGVTSPHVGRLRRVFERFVDDYQSYEGLYWSHFLAALDWQDAPLWLEGASKEKWSISGMREKRWEAEGAVDAKRPTASEIVEVDTDEDITLPAQGDGKSKDYDGDAGSVASGKTYENADFGDEEELQSLAGQTPDGESGIQADGQEAEAPAPVVQPFIGLPSLPDDLNDAIEMLKLSLLRHKATEWRDVDAEIVQKYLDAIGLMVRS